MDKKITILTGYTGENCVKAASIAMDVLLSKKNVAPSELLDEKDATLKWVIEDCEDDDHDK